MAVSFSQDDVVEPKWEFVELAENPDLGGGAVDWYKHEVGFVLCVVPVSKRFAVHGPLLRILCPRGPGWIHAQHVRHARTKNVTG